MAPKGSQNVHPAGGSRVSRLVRTVPIVPPETTCGAIAEQLHNNAEIPAVVVAGAENSFGLVDRISYLPRFLDRFNRDLFQRKPITLLMEKEPLIVDWDMPVENVGMLAAGGRGNDIRSAFIVVRNGACQGIGLGTDLMRIVAEEAQGRLVDLRDAQRNLVQAQTFASLGRLVAGVAHEINTPIGVGLTASTLLRERVAQVLAAFNEKRLKQSEFITFAETADEASSIIIDNIERAAELIRSFKSIAVDQTSAVRREFRLQELIANALRSVSPALRKANVETGIACDPALEMDSYPGPLSQVLTNLALNSALHAFGDAGGNFRVSVAAFGGWVEMVCEDDGCGIPAAHQARVFEPFFTTRRNQGGSGLGLHIVHNLVTQVLHGTIACDSDEGCGTRFELRLPRTLERAEESGPAAMPVELLALGI